jgi:hypothetical protein
MYGHLMSKKIVTFYNEQAVHTTSSKNLAEMGYGLDLGFVTHLIHSKVHSITPVATKVHVVLQSFIVLTWMRDTIKLV